MVDKYLPHNLKNLSSESQNTCQNLTIEWSRIESSTLRWEVESGEFQGAYSPASLVYEVASNTP